MNKHYVIVGSGVAAVHAAKAIRDQDADSEITIFGEETHLPYNRIKLTKGLFSDLHSDKVLIKKEKWYRDNRITLHTASRIAAIHPEAREVETADGQRVTYHKLLLCMGARNRALAVGGAGLQNVHTIRDLGDADRLKAELTAGQRTVVIGGGVQGLETAWALHEAGYPVTIIEAAPRLMARQLDETSSERLCQILEQAGVEVKLHAGVTAINGDAAVSGVTLDDGTEVPCQHVVYSIGIVPNTELVRETGIHVRSGVLVNRHLETSAPHIYAAGDIAELDGLVEGLWGGAIEQGKVAGMNMAAADPADYRRPVPVTLFNAFGSSLFSIGNTDERQCDVSAAGEVNGVYTRIYVKDNRLAGALAWDGAAASLLYKSAVERGVSLEGLDVAGGSLEAVIAGIAALVE
ncbi:NAD(P)H-nitrite reductase [Paenibacillus sp. FSL R7-0273]|uniref:NAD(P)/FAD-dependent oxidoreductase n=1 Tax=Paenibacillus sp. FSL R7-0273 TaxID=1536772 RepID=UPI0004F6D07F|nr:FAD-dependent oxidoreductase [Paenibacillus sp. FSL R7-0273]AIQ48631.1 NAD(P)H-nitrite reductase [Paenibacillus sp. FSL R7-0273]OMF94025.1 FAD-dependent oxidoreductase [Paenibacillus sp. FSL R7-0273]